MTGLRTAIIAGAFELDGPELPFGIAGRAEKSPVAITAGDDAGGAAIGGVEGDRWWKIGRWLDAEVPDAAFGFCASGIFYAHLPVVVAELIVQTGRRPASNGRPIAVCTTVKSFRPTSQRLRSLLLNCISTSLHWMLATSRRL